MTPLRALGWHHAHKQHFDRGKKKGKILVTRIQWFFLFGFGHSDVRVHACMFECANALLWLFLTIYHATNY
jgi:hypothetical protein